MERQSDPARPDSSPSPDRMGPTNVTTLVLAALISAVLSWLLINQFYGDLPRLNLLPGATLLVLAAGEAYAAYTTRARIERRPHTAKVNPLLVARYVVLAKASALAGAIFAGAYGGILVWATAEQGRLRIAEENVIPTVAGVAGSVALVIAALMLERACRVPDEPDDPSAGAPEA